MPKKAGYHYGTTNVTRIVIEIRGVPGEEFSVAELCRRIERSDGAVRDAMRAASRGRREWATIDDVEFREIRRDSIRLRPDPVTAAYDAAGAKRLTWRKAKDVRPLPARTDSGPPAPTGPDLGEAKPRCACRSSMPINPNVIGGAA